MVRDREPTAPRRTLVTRRNGWALAALLAMLGILHGEQPLTRAADLADQVLGDATRLVLDAGWLLLLLAAAGLAGGLSLSSPLGLTTARWLRRRLTARPVLVGAAAAGILVVLVLVVVVVPPRFTANRQFKTASEELKAQSDVRTTLLQGLAALLVLTGAAIGAAVTLRQVRATREGQITDRYTKAVDQLGSDHLDIRLGGIYALERIARDSPPDRATIEEVLTAYLRGHAPWPPPPALPSLRAINQRLATFAQRQRSALRRPTAKDTAEQTQPGQLQEEGAPSHGPAADVQAAVTVLGRRELPPDGLRRLDLTGVDLRFAQLFGSKLQGALLERANLQGAVLTRANLRDADLELANLRDAYLDEADLGHTDLELANLRSAHLKEADLGHAELGEANLYHASLIRANLQGARLHGANLLGALLNAAQLQHAWLYGADLRGAKLVHANLQGARADEDTRWPDGWDRAKAEARGVRYRD
jgi:uncharacterized protein YjbI with pentapeptide repeats